MIAAPYHGIDFGIADFIDDSGVVRGAWIYALEESYLNAFCLGELLHRLGESFAIVALIMEHCDLLYFEIIYKEVRCKPCLCIIRCDCAEEVRIFTALCERRRRC